MTGCHYKKCIQAPHFFIRPRCNPLLAFRAAAIAPWSCSHGKGTLLHADLFSAGKACGAIICCPSISPPTAGCHWTMFLSAGQETNKVFWILFSSTKRNKPTNQPTIVTQKGEANFTLLSQEKEKHLVMQPIVLCMHCYTIPTCGMNYQESKIQMNPKKTFHVQSLLQCCSKSYLPTLV